MAIEQRFCGSFLVEMLQGIHNFGTDTLKVALFGAGASLGFSTTAYSSTGEIVSGNYTAGGKNLPVAAGFPKADPTGAKMVLVDFDNVLWSSITANPRCALIYNSSKANRAIAVLDFGAPIVANADNFQITFPTPDQDNAIMRFI